MVKNIKFQLQFKSEYAMEIRDTLNSSEINNSNLPFNVIFKLTISIELEN